MSTSHFARRRMQLGALVAGFCLVAGSVGSAALADSGSSSGTSASVDASVLVQVGMNPINARQAAANLNSAIDSAAQTMARSAATAIPSGKPVQTTAAATRAFANEVDAALTDFVVHSIPALKSTGASTDALVKGTLAALAQVVRTIPGAVTVTVGAEISVASGADGTSASASLNPKLQTALRQTISDSVHAMQPLLPLTRATLRAVAAGVRQVAFESQQTGETGSPRVCLAGIDGLRNGRKLFPIVGTCHRERDLLHAAGRPLGGRQRRHRPQRHRVGRGLHP